jgi:hypothetical protein
MKQKKSILQNPKEADNRLGDPEIIHTLWNWKIHYCFHMFRMPSLVNPSPYAESPSVYKHWLIDKVIDICHILICKR